MQQHVAEQLVRQVEEGHDAESVVLLQAAAAARCGARAVLATRAVLVRQFSTNTRRLRG